MRSNKFSSLKRLSGGQKLLLCILLAVCLSAVLFFSRVSIIKCILFGWDFFCFSMILIYWITFITTSSDRLHSLAKKQDENLPVTFIIVVVLVCFSLLGTVFLIINKDLNSSVISLLGIAFSWILLHTIFTIRYAHKYYEHANIETDVHSGGLDFPNEKEPDYIDFAYFSFVIGMTFQVSDVSVSSRKLRRLVLIHGLISFVFNAIIVALTISIIANLKQ
jgi:uncharacterized membrane protein